MIFPKTFGSSLSASTSRANVENGGTPNIGLSWTAASNVLELHSSSSWDHIDPSSPGVDVLQLDLDGENPTHISLLQWVAERYYY